MTSGIMLVALYNSHRVGIIKMNWNREASLRFCILPGLDGLDWWVESN